MFEDLCHASQKVSDNCHSATNAETKSNGSEVINKNIVSEEIRATAHDQMLTNVIL